MNISKALELAQKPKVHFNIHLPLDLKVTVNDVQGSHELLAPNNTYEASLNEDTWRFEEGPQGEPLGPELINQKQRFYRRRLVNQKPNLNEHDEVFGYDEVFGSCGCQYVRARDRGQPVASHVSELWTQMDSNQFVPNTSLRLIRETTREETLKMIEYT